MFILGGRDTCKMHLEVEEALLGSKEVGLNIGQLIIYRAYLKSSSGLTNIKILFLVNSRQ